MKLSKAFGISRKLEKLMKVPGMSSLFVSMWDPVTKKKFRAGNWFKNVFYPKKKGEYRMITFPAYNIGI